MSIDAFLKFFFDGVYDEVIDDVELIDEYVWIDENVENDENDETLLHGETHSFDGVVLNDEKLLCCVLFNELLSWIWELKTLLFVIKLPINDGSHLGFSGIYLYVVNVLKIYLSILLNFTFPSSLYLFFTRRNS